MVLIMKNANAKNVTSETKSTVKPVETKTAKTEKPVKTNETKTNKLYSFNEVMKLFDEYNIGSKSKTNNYRIQVYTF